MNFTLYSLFNDIIRSFGFYVIFRLYMRKYVYGNTYKHMFTNIYVCAFINTLCHI
jgi:hypothetical protein